MYFNMHHYIWHAYSILLFRHVAVFLNLWFYYFQIKLIHLVETAEVKMPTGWMAIKKGASGVLDSQIFAPRCQDKAFALHFYCKEIQWYSLSYHSISLNSFTLLSSSLKYPVPLFPFPTALPPQVRRSTWWTLPNYPWTPPAEVILWE